MDKNSIIKWALIAVGAYLVYQWLQSQGLLGGTTVAAALPAGTTTGTATGTATGTTTGTSTTAGPIVAQTQTQQTQPPASTTNPVGSGGAVSDKTPATPVVTQDQVQQYYQNVMNQLASQNAATLSNPLTQGLIQAQAVAAVQNWLASLGVDPLTFTTGSSTAAPTSTTNTVAPVGTPSDTALMLAAADSSQTGPVGDFMLNGHQWNWYRTQYFTTVLNQPYDKTKMAPDLVGVNPDNPMTVTTYWAALHQLGLSGIGWGGSGMAYGWSGRSGGYLQ